MNNNETENSQKKIKEIASSIWGFFIVKRTLSWLILITIVVSGIYSYLTIPREIQPEINIPFVAVSAVLPGASPQDTESLLTEPLEKEISTVSDIKLLSSTSNFSSTFIFIEFEASADIDNSLQEVKNAVDRAKINFPEDALEPNVQKAEPNSFSIISFSIIGDRPIFELTQIAKEVENELEKINGVSNVEILGGEEKFIKVEVDRKKLEGYGLSMEQVANLIKLAHSNVPVGIISSDSLNYSVRIDNRFQNMGEIQNLPLFTISGENPTPILLSDIAKISEELPQQNTISEVSVKGEKSLPAVTLQIFKKENTNILEITAQAKKKIEELKTNRTIPEGVNILVVNDNSLFIEEALGDLTSNGVQTAIAIIIILFLALGFVQGTISGLTIPITFLMTFPILDYMGMTFNTLSLFSLVMSLGITIDTTVVIMEGMYEHLKKGFTPFESALLSVDMYKWPLIAGTLTNIFAFFPMLLVSGILGEFLKTMPITITASLITSLFLSLTIAPALASKFIKKEEAAHKHHSIMEPFFTYLGNKFEKWTPYLLKRRLTRFLVVALSIVAFAISTLLPTLGILKVEMFPQTDQNYFIVEIETRQGLVTEETAKIASDIEEYLYKIPEIDNFLTQIGTSSSVALSEDSTFLATGSNESHLANITINLVKKENRKRESFVIAEEVREHFSKYQKAKVTVEEIQEGPPSEDPITVRLTGTDLDELKLFAEKTKNIVENVEGTNNTRLNLTPGLNEFKFTVNKEKAAYYGLSPIQIASTIRNIVQGIKATTINLQGEDYDVIVAYKFEEKNKRANLRIPDLQNFQIATQKGPISLSQVASYEFMESINSISREDQKRIIKVVSAIDKNANAVQINSKIEEEMAKLEIPSGVEVNFGGDLEEINESFKELFTSMIVGILLILVTMVLMFNSFKQPLIILFTLPLALIGVFPGLYIMGLNLSFPAFLGVVSLAGIVVNNGIVLIDRINENRKNGMEFTKSIAEASNSRIEAIFMTSVTTIIGVIPLAFANAFWAGLGYTIAFGQLFSAALVLLVIPVLYYSFEIRKERKRLAKGENL